MSTTKTPLSEIISVADLAWQERQPGVRMKSIWEHPETKRRAVMTRIEPDAKLPLHRHVGDELVFVIEGAKPVTERGSAPPSQIFALSELPWVEARSGVRQKRIWEDKLNERRALLARFEPGATLPRHRHVGDELIFILEGANADESGVVATGNVSYRPNGCVHSVTTKNGATVLAVVWGRTEPV